MNGWFKVDLVAWYVMFKLFCQLLANITWTAFS